MNHSQLIPLAESLIRGDFSAEEWLEQLQTTEEKQYSTVDLERQSRCGFPEVIYAAGKSCEALQEIIHVLHDAGQPILATRVSPEQFTFLQQQFPEGEANQNSRTWCWQKHPLNPDSKSVAVICAGSSDLPIAEEAYETLQWMGIPAELIVDVGVAGPQRLQAHIDLLQQQAAIVVTAGMEGALPSVVGGYVPCPVIAVPTSVGYGTALSGWAALLGMLNSCAANVTVVNIDAGFKGGYIAGLIATEKNNERSNH